MLGAGHTKAKMVVRSRQVPESEVMRALVSSALISGIDPLRNNLKRAAAQTRKVKEKTARRRHLSHACSVNQH